MKKLILLVTALTVMSCKKDEEVLPKYWVLKNYQDTEIIVKHLSNTDTLRKDETIVVFNKPTFGCLNLSCIVSINGKFFSTEHLGEY